MRSGRIRPLKVLLVEDSKILVDRLSEAIDRTAGVNLIGATDVEAVAIAVISKEDVDVIVLDLHLKQGTGFGVLRALASVKTKATVIVLTNYDLPEYRNAALALGATHFLDKACDYSRLTELLVEIRNRQALH
jgi:DNA-binding NarL/FixJ family response regulator